MAEQFYTILTRVGKSKLANANALGTKLNLTKFMVGDGSGDYYNPTEEQAALKNKVWEGPISDIGIDKDNPSWMIFQAALPGNIGGFTIRETGISDSDGDLIAIGKFPETYKPAVSEGSSKDITIKMILEISNANSVTLNVDPTIMLATKEEVEVLQSDLNLHLDDSTSHVTPAERTTWNSKAEKTYVDEQIQTVTATGIPKLVSYEYDLYATVEGQTVFEIPYDYYNHVTDTLIVEASGIDGPKNYYAITDPVTNPDNSITRGYITLAEGRPIGSFLKMRILKNVPIGPDGAISGRVMAVNSIPQDRVEGLVDLSNKVGSGEAITPTLSYGMNSKITMSAMASELLKMGFTGQTLVNLLGKDGNCEDLTKWVTANTTLSLDSTKKVLGGNAIKITTTSTSNCTMYRGINFYISDMTKYYMISAYLDKGNSTSIELMKDSSGGGVTKSVLSTAITPTRTMVRVQPSDFGASNQFAIRVNSSISGQYGYVDGIQINEISVSDYTNLTDAQLLAKYPYVDSYTCLQNPYIEVRHDNLVRNGNGEEGIAWWVANDSTNVITIENGKFKITTSNGSRAYFQYIPVKPNTTYYLLGNISGLGYISVNDDLDVVQLRNGIGTFSTGNYSKIKVYMGTTASGIGYVDSIHLIEGTTPPAQYLPCRIERCTIEGKFTSEDSVTLENGKLSGQVNWKHRVLYGKDYDWKFQSDDTGSKQLIISNVIPNVNYSTGNRVAVKYDGKILKNALNLSTGGDIIYDGSSSQNNVIISISDADTGWAETINPNDDEVKALMNGWKATSNNGTRYVMWCSIVDGSMPNATAYVSGTNASGQNKLNVTYGAGFATGDTIRLADGNVYTINFVSGNQITLTSNLVATVNDGLSVCKYDNGTTDTSLLNYCKSNVAPNYEGYQLHYKLANPEPITDMNTKLVGTLPKLDKGDNYIFLDSGIVLGEVVSPNTDAINYYINAQSTPLKSKVEQLFNSYKNNIFATGWVITPNTGTNITNFGNQFMYTPNANFDTNATYTVDYKILATIAPLLGSIACSYAQDVFSAIKSNTEAIETRQKQDSVLDAIIDKSVYEVIDFGNWRHFVWACSDTLYIDIIIPLIPKKAIPTIKINSADIRWGTGGNIISNISISSVTPSKDSVSIKYRVLDANLITNIKNNGVYGRLNITADCRGRL